MTNLGLKIVGDEMEAGFTVSSREEFDDAIRRLETVAATVWVQELREESEHAHDLRAPAHDDPTVGFSLERVAAMRGPSGDDARAKLAEWREKQGLR